jgi:Zn-dependent peptidase ImmA (M78 family)
MNASSSEIVCKANHIIQQCGTRDPHKIADELGIEILYCPFTLQKGAYKVVMKNRFMFVREDLDPIMEKIVLLHELGHDTLHRAEATKVGGFEEFNIFDIRDSRMEYEANVFAAQIALPDDDFLELTERGYDVQQIAQALHSDVNLVALKADTLISQGYRLRQQEHRNDFLKYNR